MFYVCMWIYTYTYMYTHIYRHTHIHIYIHIACGGQKWASYPCSWSNKQLVVA